MEKTHKPTITQAFFYSDDEGQKALDGRHIVLLPRFEVKWGSNDMHSAVWVSIFGPTKQAIHIRQEDISFSKRPKGLVNDKERLLAIPNNEFGRYTLPQKSNLVVESSVTRYPTLSLPEVLKSENSKVESTQRPPKGPGTQRKINPAATNIHKLAPTRLQPPKSLPQP